MSRLRWDRRHLDPRKLRWKHDWTNYSRRLRESDISEEDWRLGLVIGISDKKILE